jgi:AraC-like DNA-binding protein
MTGPPRNPSHDPAMARLFAQLTGLRFEFLPAPPPGLDWDTRPLIASCRVHARRLHVRPERTGCEACARRHVRRSLGAGHVGHECRGACGVHFFLLPVLDAAGPQGLLVLRDARCTSASRARPEPAGMSRPVDEAGRSFHTSVLLLRLLAHDMELEQGAARSNEEQLRLSRAEASREREEDRLRRDLQRIIPTVRRSPATRSSGTHARQIVEMILQRVCHDYSQALTLAQIADEIRMNPSYLSWLFALHIGMPFKTYLTTLRLQRAQALLSDPRRQIKDVARRVGYASPGRFRAAFRDWTGLAPTRWRSTLRVRPAVGPDRKRRT